MYKIMTPGPTPVRENVRMARSLETTNPDLDPAFYDFYKATCEKLATFIGTKDLVYILGGEGILGLEAACASLTEPGDRVLVIDNGIFGRGFADFVKIYGGEPVMFTCDYHRPVERDELKAFLERDRDFKYATLVHMDTPSGVLNPVDRLCPLLKEYGILTVVDSVAGMFGEPLNMDESRIDILCGGSQKALSAPPGLTITAVSRDAIAAMENRTTPIASFYANLLLFKDYYKDQWFPYTMPVSDITGLAVALDNVLEDKDIFLRHSRISKAVRKAVTGAGLELYLDEGFSNNVTVIKVPDGIKDTEILDTMRDTYGIMIAGCFDVLAGKVIRIGHMGESACEDAMAETLEALEKTLEYLGSKLTGDMKGLFLKGLTSTED